MCVIRRHFLACEDLAVGFELSAAVTIFSRNTSGPFGGSLLSDGGIIIFRVIRTHFLVAAVDLAVSLSTYSTLLMEVIT